MPKRYRRKSNQFVLEFPLPSSNVMERIYFMAVVINRQLPAHDEVYSIHHCVIKFVSCGRSVVFSGYSGFLHQ